VAENGISRDEQLCSRFDDVRDRFQVHATIYFNPEIEFALGTHASECCDFVQRIRNELLPTKARIHAHDQDVMDEIQDFCKRFDGSGRVKNNSRPAAVRGDQVECAIQMNAGFLVNRDPVGAGLGELRNEEVRIFDH